MYPVPLNCYDRLKVASMEIKQILSSCRMRVSVSVYENTPKTVCVYVCSACSVLRVCMTRKQAVYADRLNLWISAVGVTCSFRGSQTRTHECFPYWIILFRRFLLRILNPFHFCLHFCWSVTRVLCCCIHHCLYCDCSAAHSAQWQV